MSHFGLIFRQKDSCRRWNSVRFPECVSEPIIGT